MNARNGLGVGPIGHLDLGTEHARTADVVPESAEKGHLLRGLAEHPAGCPIGAG